MYLKVLYVCLTLYSLPRQNVGRGRDGAVCCGTRTGVQGDLPRTSKVALNPLSELQFSRI